MRSQFRLLYCLQVLSSIANAIFFLIIHSPGISYKLILMYDSCQVHIRLPYNESPFPRLTPIFFKRLPPLIIKSHAQHFTHLEYNMRLLIPVAQQGILPFHHPFPKPSVKPTRNYPAYQPKYPPVQQSSGNAAADARPRRSQSGRPSSLARVSSPHSRSWRP